MRTRLCCAIGMLCLIAQATASPAYSAKAGPLHEQLLLAEKLVAISRMPSVDPTDKALALARVALTTTGSATGWLGRTELANIVAASNVSKLTSSLPRSIDSILTQRAVQLLGLRVAHIVAAPKEVSLGLAIQHLLSRYNRSVPAEVSAIVSTINALPSRVGMALANVVSAFDRFDVATRAVYQRANPTRLKFLQRTLRNRLPSSSDIGFSDPGTALRWTGLDFSSILITRSRLLEAVLKLRSAIKDSPKQLLAVLPPIQVPPVLSIDLRSTDDTYTQDYRLQIDAGGNDTYLNNAGGNGVLDDSHSPCSLNLITPPIPNVARGAAALIALGQKNSFVSGRSCGVNGGGIEGAGFLYDAGQDDVFIAGNEATNGGGEMGLGFLMHDGGAARYTAGSGSTNGGGYLGAGSLIEIGGATSYSAGFIATNGGGTLGVGALMDLGNKDKSFKAREGGTNGGGDGFGSGFLYSNGGHDAYSAILSGANGGGSSGAGFLFKAAGNSAYSAAGFGTNGGADFGGIGMLINASGSNVYTAGLDSGFDLGGDDGTNGGGSTVGEGFLIDNGDSATFSAGTGATNGGALAGGQGTLFHGNGTATFTAGRDSTNGGAAIGGIGRLIDAGSHGTYSTTGSLSVNGGAEEALGLLFNAGGHGTYQDASETKTDCTTVRGTVGFQIDASSTSC